MRIREGDPLEIFVSNEGEVIFKKYSPISELGSIAAQYCEVLYRTAGYLSEAFGDLEGYITALIEATVKRVKNGSVA